MLAPSGTATLSVISIAADLGTDSRAARSLSAAKAPRTLRYLFAQVTFCGLAPEFNMKVSHAHCAPLSAAIPLC